MTKRLLAFTTAAVLAIASVLTVFAAENAKGVETAGGRSVIVHDVSGTVGEAVVERGGKTFAPAKGVRLAQGDVLKTTGDHKIYLAIDSSMILRLDPEGEAEITKSTFGQKLTVTVVKGQMFYNVAKQNGGNASLELMTNNVTIAIRGTSGVLGSKSGTIQHMLFDGEVEVSDGNNVIQQVPGEMLEAVMGPAGDITTALEVEKFTLADIPESLVEEMKADEDLMARVLESVPLAVNADGTPVYADAETFAQEIKGVEDSEVFKDTAIPSSVEMPEEKKAPEPEPEPAPKPAPEPEPTPEPETEVCRGCGKTITKGDPAHAKKTFACGDEDYACCEEKHELLHCEDCDEDYYACDTAKCAEHARIAAEDMICGGACLTEGKTDICSSKYMAAEHELTHYSCDVCEVYTCVKDAEEAKKHAKFNYTELDCGGRHEWLTDPVCVTDTKAVEDLKAAHARVDVECEHAGKVFECSSDKDKHALVEVECELHAGEEYYGCSEEIQEHLIYFNPCPDCDATHWACEGHWAPTPS